MMTIKAIRTGKLYKITWYRKPAPLRTLMYLIIDPDTGEVQEITADFYNKFIMPNVEVLPV